MTDRIYLERGLPVTVVCRGTWRRGEIRNVLIRRQNGSLVCRPFRGLRKEVAK